LYQLTLLQPFYTANGNLVTYVQWAIDRDQITLTFAKSDGYPHRLVLIIYPEYEGSFTS
jgi:hypothetical protein